MQNRSVNFFTYFSPFTFNFSPLYMLLNDKLKPYRLLLASQSPRRRS